MINIIVSLEKPFWLDDAYSVICMHHISVNQPPPPHTHKKQKKQKTNKQTTTPQNDDTREVQYTLTDYLLTLQL